MENNKNQTPVTEEVKEWSVGFMKTVETEGYDSMVSKLNELTPELKDGVLGYLQRIIDYCVVTDLKNFLEGVDNYKKLIKEVKIKKIWKPRSIYGDTQGWNCGRQTHTNRSEIPVYEKLVG